MSTREQRSLRYFVLIIAVMAVIGRTSLSLAQQPSNRSVQQATMQATQAAGQTIINFYDDGDTNITDWYSKVIIPAFEKQYPQYKVNFTIARGGTGMRGILDRTLAALQTNSDPQADLIAASAQDYPDTVKAGLWLEISTTNVPNLKDVNPASIELKFSIPYRGSQVLLAYDSDKVKEADVPHTFPDLLKWVKANKGQFVYCRPDKGGSGGNFVQRAIYEATGKDPKIFNSEGDPKPEILAQYDKAWQMLSDINSSIYEDGSYPAGNNPVLKLLGNGSVSMATVWSDQALQALSRGDLPASIKLTQLTDFPFPGGYAWNAIPKNATNKEGALALANFLLTPDIQQHVVKDIGGFPALNWTLLPKELQTQYTSVVTSNVPPFLPNAYDKAMVTGWYEKVATNIKQGS